MKLLYLTNSLPHAAARDSGRLDTYHYIATLAQRHEVTVLSFVWPGDEPYVSQLASVCHAVYPIPFDPSRLSGRIGRLIGRQLFTKVYGRTLSLPFWRALGRLADAHRFDLAIVDGPLALYGAQLQRKGVKIVLDEVDLFGHVAYHHMRNAKNRWEKGHLWQDWLRTVSREAGFWRSYDGLLVRSEKDRALIRELEPAKGIAIAPIWFEGLDELQRVPVERPDGNRVLYVGAMGLKPNIEAVQQFADRVWPHILAHVPDATFEIVGSRPSSDVQTLEQRPGIVVVGEVETLAPSYAAGAVAVVPLQIGGGIICKTLNGMAAARPTVVTTLGNSGTGAVDGRDLLIRDRPEAMAQAVIELLRDQAQWDRYAQAGRLFIQDNYGWEREMAEMENFLMGIVNPDKLL